MAQPVDPRTPEERVGETGAGIITTMVAGFILAAVVARRGSPISADKIVDILTHLLFLVGIPALVWRGIASRELELFSAPFVLVFLNLRVISLVLALAVQGVRSVLWRRGLCWPRNIPGTETLDDIGGVVELFMGNSWLNTIIFGIPLVSAAIGPEGIVYCILAALSSFFFQTPLQVLLLEIRESLKPLPAAPLQKQSPSHTSAAAPHDTPTENDEETTEAAFTLSLGPCLGLIPASTFPQDWRRPAIITLLSTLTNPVVWGICLGFITRAGLGKGEPLPLYLDETLESIGNIVEPLAALSVGIFAFAHARSLLYAPWITIIGLLLYKLFLMPLIAFALLRPLPGPIARAGVIIASLPLAHSAFVFGRKYQNADKAMAALVIFGSALMVPVSLLWTSAKPI